ncbi:MAG: hypothetical protein K2H49_03850 [Muribaculaceae bacterium]|nr:hypothetical protein [Muribaculaceae bacterium]
MIARERHVMVLLYMFCVRLLRCPFYSNGQFQGLNKRNGQRVQALTLFIFIIHAFRRVGGTLVNGKEHIVQVIRML